MAPIVRPRRGSPFQGFEPAPKQVMLPIFDVDLANPSFAPIDRDSHGPHGIRRAEPSDEPSHLEDFRRVRLVVGFNSTV